MIWHRLIEWLTDPNRLRIHAGNLTKAFAILAIYFVFILLMERLTGGPIRQYKTRGFFQDMVYWAWHRAGFAQVFTLVTILNIMSPGFALFNLRLLEKLPYVPRFAIYFLVFDFMGYAVHRYIHSNGFLWAFHTTHHSQENLNFVTAYRLHPLDEFFGEVIQFVPVAMLGAPVHDWFPILYLRMFLNAVQHSRIPWRFGPFYYIVVSPAFHAFHHSKSAEHHDKNFGTTLSIWDFIFGTAVDKAELPQEYGLSDVKMPTIVSTIVVPFRIVYETYFHRQASSKRVADS
jgi:sterol desaturase/sphingolipid hydroxylase (fatty acid hydroxylase superfamily)